MHDTAHGGLTLVEYPDVSADLISPLAKNLLVRLKFMYICYLVIITDAVTMVTRPGIMDFFFSFQDHEIE